MRPAIYVGDGRRDVKGLRHRKFAKEYRSLIPLGVARNQTSQRPPLKDPASKQHQRAWLIRCVAGLHALQLDELRKRGIIGDQTSFHTVRQRNFDLILLASRTKKKVPPDLRLAEQVLECPVYGRFKFSKSQITRLAEAMKRKHRPFRIASTAEGTHFNRKTFGNWLGRELEGAGIRINPDANDVLFLFSVDQSFYTGLEFATRDDAPMREERAAERMGSLPPTIAAAMAFLASPRAGERVVDPMCGTGTLIAEALAQEPSLECLACDLDEQATAAARRNLRSFSSAEVEQASFTQVDLPAGSVQLVLCNLPFGKQFGSKDTNPTLYQNFLERCATWAAPEVFRMVVLTSDTAAFSTAMEKTKLFYASKTVRVKVRGEWAEMILLRKR